MTKRKKFKISAEVFAIGSVGYSVIEILWRGNTHWTMTLTGGACLTTLYYLYDRFQAQPLWKKALTGATVITAFEFVVGCIVNLALHWNVWNYEKLPGNILGQICPLFYLLWFLLSIPVVFLCSSLQKQLTK